MHRGNILVRPRQPSQRGSKARSHTWRIKHSDGRIEDWVCEFACKLTTTHHLPTSHTPSAVVDIVRAIKANVVDHGGTENDQANTYTDTCGGETFSNCSGRRFLLEGHVMGQVQLAQEFKAAPGRESYLLPSYGLSDFTRSMDCQ